MEDSVYKDIHSCLASNITLTFLLKTQEEENDIYAMIEFYDPNIHSTLPNFINDLLKYFSANNKIVLFKKMIEYFDTDLSATGNILLKIACVNNSYDIVKCLISNGVEVHAFNNVAIKYAAAVKGDEKLLNLLLMHGADIHAENDTPFRYAVSGINKEVIKFFLDHGADPNLQDGYPLKRFLKLYTGAYDMTKLVLEAGANVNVLNKEDFIYLIKTAKFDVLKILIDYGADISVLNNYHSQENSKIEEAVELLVNNNVDLAVLVKILLVSCQIITKN